MYRLITAPIVGTRYSILHTRANLGFLSLLCFRGFEDIHRIGERGKLLQGDLTGRELHAGGGQVS